MATHPHGPVRHGVEHVNGSSNGHGGAISVRLARMLAHHEGIAASIRTVMAELTDDAVAGKQKSTRRVLSDAIELDHARRGTRGPDKKKRRSPKRKKLGRPPAADPTAGQSKRARQRLQSARLLAEFSPDKTTLLADAMDESRLPALASRGIGALVRRGYLKKSGEGYLRTTKEFEL